MTDEPTGRAERCSRCGSLIEAMCAAMKLDKDGEITQIILDAIEDVPPVASAGTPPEPYYDPHPFVNERFSKCGHLRTSDDYCPECEASSEPASTGTPPSVEWSRNHLAHVQRFLIDMYQTMVDPVEEYRGNIEELCTLLLQRARQDRETIHGLQTSPSEPGSRIATCDYQRSPHIRDSHGDCGNKPCSNPKEWPSEPRSAEQLQPTCETHGHIFGPMRRCVFCKIPQPPSAEENEFRKWLGEGPTDANFEDGAMQAWAEQEKRKREALASLRTELGDAEGDLAYCRAQLQEREREIEQLKFSVASLSDSILVYDKQEAEREAIIQRLQKDIERAKACPDCAKQVPLDGNQHVRWDNDKGHERVMCLAEATLADAEKEIDAKANKASDR